MEAIRKAIPLVQAIALHGSRAREEEGENSDWDVDVLAASPIMEDARKHGNILGDPWREKLDVAMDEVVASKVESIERCIHRVLEEYRGHEEAFANDYRRQHSITSTCSVPASYPACSLRWSGFAISLYTFRYLEISLRVC